LQSLIQWDWPGNITELSQTLKSVLDATTSSLIERRHLPKQLQRTEPRRQLSMLETAERAAIISALDTSNGNKSETALLLGIGRTTLYRRLRQFGLDAGEATL